MLASERGFTGAGRPDQQDQRRCRQVEHHSHIVAHTLGGVEQAPQLESRDVPFIVISDEPAQVARPTKELPLSHLLTLSLYWLGINAIWSGLHVIILPKRMEAIFGLGEAGLGLAV